jgi:hypothetical protein
LGHKEDLLGESERGREGERKKNWAKSPEKTAASFGLKSKIGT